MISFEQQVIAITGAGNGIGLATARLMAAHGARLALTDIDGARLAQVAAELDPGGERVRAYALDVSSSTDCDRALAGRAGLRRAGPRCTAPASIRKAWCATPPTRAGKS